MRNVERDHSSLVLEGDRWVAAEGMGAGMEAPAHVTSSSAKCDESCRACHNTQRRTRDQPDMDTKLNNKVARPVFDDVSSKVMLESRHDARNTVSVTLGTAPT
jgi:hypothetical protein